jgi:hypothetical protein
MKIKFQSWIQHHSILQYMLNDTFHSGVSIKEANLFVTQTWYPLPHTWYYWKALDKWRCIEIVL